MEFKHGEPISTLLSDYLIRYTTDEDVKKVREKNGSTRSISTIQQIKRGQIPINNETQVFIEDLFEIAVKQQAEERKKFAPLIKDKKVAA